MSVQTDAFKKTYVAKLREFNDTILKAEPIYGHVDDLANVLRPGITEESADRLAELNRAAAGERVTISMGLHGASGTPLR
jgi:hypothetical protein